MQPPNPWSWVRGHPHRARGGARGEKGEPGRGERERSEDRNCIRGTLQRRLGERLAMVGKCWIGRRRVILGMGSSLAFDFLAKLSWLARPVFNF